MAIVKGAEGELLAILNRNDSTSYRVSTKMYEAIIDILKDIRLTELIEKRTHEHDIEVDINEL